MTATRLAVAGLFVTAAIAMLFPTFASAQPYRRYHRARPVVVLPPPPPPVIIRPAPVVVRPAPPPVIVEVEPEPEDRFNYLSIGARVTGLGMEGHKLHLSDLENPVMGGAGVQLRSRFDDYFGIELAADFLGGSTEDFTQFQVPITLSVLFYPFPNSRIQPYLLAGGGVQFTQLDYFGGEFEYNLTEVVGQLGVGVDLWLTDRLALNADVRFLGAYKNLGSRAEISAACYASASSGSGICAGINSLDVNDRFNGGIQFLAGVSYAF